MIKKLERSTEHVFGVEIDGKAEHGIFEEFEAELDEMMKKEKINFVFVLKNFSGYGIKDMLSDFRFSFKHWNNIGKIAVVGDKAWEKVATSIDNIFTKWEEKYFDIADIEKAWEWAE